jgi:multiple sugar transport system permease protein
MEKPGSDAMSIEKTVFAPIVGRWQVWALKLRLTGYALSAPAIFLMFVLLIAPLISVFLISFTDWQLGETEIYFIGLENYRAMLNDEVFRKSIINTIIYSGILVPISVFIGLFLALLIESLKVGKAFYRAVYFLPVMATLIAMAIVWQVMLNPDFGLVNIVLRRIGLSGYNWLNNPSIALFSLCAIGIWQAVGFNMVLFMAGLTSIPRELYDAAELDGAGSFWNRFCTVTWPLLSPMTMFVLVITGIRSFQVFDTVHVLTKGGPNNASEVLIHTMYTEAFEFFRSGYAGALTVVLLLFVLTFTLIQMWIIERKVHYL